MPRNTRNPATVSAPSPTSLPDSSRWRAWRFCKGLTMTDSEASRTGTPSRTSSPSSVEARSRMTATTTYETIAPANRAETS
jgi:hypothetical protein